MTPDGKLSLREAQERLFLPGADPRHPTPAHAVQSVTPAHMLLSMSKVQAYCQDLELKLYAGQLSSVPPNGCPQPNTSPCGHKAPGGPQAVLQAAGSLSASPYQPRQHSAPHLSQGRAHPAAQLSTAMQPVPPQPCLHPPPPAPEQAHEAHLRPQRGAAQAPRSQWTWPHWKTCPGCTLCT